jgi:hypothetical protein
MSYSYDRRSERPVQALWGGRDYDKLLDAILDGLQGTDRVIEKAHETAPSGAPKAILTGLHQDLFQTISEFRGYIKQLKSMK